MEEIQKLKSLLNKPQDVVILSHRNPDGDAVGSSMGLAGFLQKLRHAVKVVFPSEYPGSFQYIEGIDQAIIFDINPQIAREAVQKATLIFCLDFNSLDRIDKLGEAVKFSTALKVLIDHHLDPEPFAEFTLSDTAASSTSELVYEFIKELDMLHIIDEMIGVALYTGIVTDTGSFKYATRPNTYHVAGFFKSMGVDDYQIQNLIHNSLKEKHLRLLGHCLANRMEVLGPVRSAIIHLTKEDYKTFDIQRGDTEGIVNYLLMMKDIDVAVFVTEQPSIIKLSFRSKGDINVQDLASSYFNGGGHKNASGGSAYAKLEDILDKVRRVLPYYVRKSN